MMFFDPPLVLIPQLPLFLGRALGDSIRRRKNESAPTPLWERGDVRRFERERDGWNRPVAGGRKKTIERPVIRVGRRAAVAEQNQLAAALQAIVDGERGLDDLPGLLIRHLDAKLGVLSRP